MTSLLELAEAEAAAAERRTVAEAVWRSKWWQTTVAIGALPVTGVGKELERIAPVLGSSTRWLGSRRSLGMKIALDDEELLAKVPPRLAVEYVKGDQKLDAAGARFLIEWEEQDKSLRDLATHLGTAGRSWQNAAQLDQAEATRLAQSKPSVEQIREALADPEVAREVVAHGPTRAAFQGATDSWARETTRDTKWTPPPTNTVQDDRLAQLTLDLMRAKELIGEARRISNDIPLDTDATNGVMLRLEEIIAAADSMKMSLSAHARFSSELESLGGAR